MNHRRARICSSGRHFLRVEGSGGIGAEVKGVGLVLELGGEHAIKSFLGRWQVGGAGSSI